MALFSLYEVVGVGVVAGLVWVVWTVWVYPYYVSPLRHLPQPSGNHWLLGQTKRILAEPLGMPMRQWIKEIPNDGLIRYLGAFNQERVLVCSPRALAEVLVTNTYTFAKPYQLRWSIGRIIGIGLLLAEGQEHKAQRRLLLPAFHYRHIKNLYPVFWSKAREVTQILTERIRAQPDEPVDISTYSSRAALDIIGLAGVGKDFEALKNPGNALVTMYERIFEPSRADEIMGIFGRIIPFWFIAKLPFKRNQFLRQAAGDLRTVCRDLVDEKRANLANKEKTQDLDILSIAMRNDPTIANDHTIEENVLTLLAAGHETSASTIVWATYLLCRYPEVQTRLRQEIQSFLPSVDSEEGVTSSDIDKMPYLNAVCNEVLRYYGPLPLTSRHATRGTTIQGQHIPRGSRVVVVPWATNHDPKLWGPDADRFDPERWLVRSGSPEDLGGGHGQDESTRIYTASKAGGASTNFAFLTFSQGPRGCVGQGFARAEFACLLSALIGRFEFSLDDTALLDETTIQIRRGITVRPKGLKVKVKIAGSY